MSSPGLQGTPGLEPLLMYVDDYAKAVAPAYGCLPTLQFVKQDLMHWLQRFQLCWLPCGTCFCKCHVRDMPAAVCDACLLILMHCTGSLSQTSPTPALKVLQCSTTGQQPVQTGLDAGRVLSGPGRTQRSFPLWDKRCGTGLGTRPPAVSTPCQRRGGRGQHPLTRECMWWQPTSRPCPGSSP